MASIPAGSSTDLTLQRERRQPLATLPAGTYGYGSDAPGPELSLGLLWRVAVEWRWLILAAMVLGLAGGIIVTMLTTPLYRSFVTLEVNPPRVQVLDKEDQDKQGVQSWDFIATQVGLLQSRAVAEAMAATQRPLSYFAQTEPSGQPAWKTLPSWALVTLDDHAISPGGQVFMAKRAGAHIEEVHSAHDVMVSHPADVVRIVLDAVRAVR